MSPADLEQRAIMAALENELSEVEAAYPDERLAAIVYGSKAKDRKRLQQQQQQADDSGAEEDSRLLSLEMVDALCDEDAALGGDADGEEGMSDDGDVASTLQPDDLVPWCTKTNVLVEL